MYLVLFAIGLGITAIALRQREDVPQIAALVAGVILLIWGFIHTPTSIQMGLEILGIIWGLCSLQATALTSELCLKAEPVDKSGRLR